jgi:hypothetical protein
MLRSSCDHRALPPSGPPDGVRWCSLEGSASRSSLPVTSPPECSRLWWCRRTCLLFAAVGGVHTSWGLVLFHHHSASRIFITQPGRNLRPVVIHKDDYQPCGGEKRAGLRPPPCPQLQGCSSSALGRRASRVGVLPSAWAGGPLLPAAFGGEGHSPALRRRRTPGTWGRPSATPSAAACLAPRPGWLWCRLRHCLLPLGRGVAVRPPHGRRSRRAQVGHIHGFSRAVGRTGGSYKTSYAVGAAAAFLDGLVLTPAARTGARTFLRVLGQPPPIGAEVVAAAGGADVVAAAGEATHCRGGCLR